MRLPSRFFVGYGKPGEHLMQLGNAATIDRARQMHLRMRRHVGGDFGGDFCKDL